MHDSIFTFKEKNFKEEYMSYLQCTNLFKQHNNFTLDISFAIDKGSFVSIVGPSGSGKSTILRIIAGLTESDGNGTKIVLDNKDITRLAPGDRECGMCFQNSALFLNMSVQDNVAYGLRCKGISKKESRKQAVEFLKIFKMEDFAIRFPETLSGGEAQRVSLARTLIVHPNRIIIQCFEVIESCVSLINLMYFIRKYATLRCNKIVVIFQFLSFETSFSYVTVIIYCMLDLVLYHRFTQITYFILHVFLLNFPISECIIVNRSVLFLEIFGFKVLIFL